MNRLIKSLTAICHEQLVTEKWLVAPSRRVGYQWLDQVARQGQPAINVHVKTFVTMALELAAPVLTAQQVAMVSPRASMLLVDQVIRSLADGKLDYLAQAQPSVGLAETVLASINSIRLAGLSATDLDRASFEVSRKGDDVEAILGSYLDLLKQEKLVDYASILQTAIEQLQSEESRLDREVLVLLPQATEFAALERQLLESLPAGQHIRLAVDPLAATEDEAESAATDLDLCRWLTDLTTAPPPLQDGTVQMFRAVGEVNEVRGMLRYCLKHKLPWDEVELLHADTDCYVSLIYETFSSLDRSDVEIGDELPVTFAEGIACRYSRPGRALLGWIQWINSGWSQHELVKIVKQGLLKIENVDEDDLDFSRLGRQITDLGLVFGRDRFLPRLEARMTSVRRRLEELEESDAAEENRTGRANLQRRLEDLQQVKELVATLLDVTPSSYGGQREVVVAARAFLESLARCVSKLDHFAVQKLLAELDDMAHWLERCAEESAIDIWQWLRSLPAETRVMGSAPQPGCLHVDSVYRGGHSGRPTTLIVGLDDRRFPNTGAQDPLLLDSERLALSAALPTASHRREEGLRDFARLLARLRGQLVVSFSSQTVTGDGETFPSPVLLTLHRLLTGNPDSDQQALLRHLPAAESFAPSDGEACLDQVEWWMWRLTENNRVSNLENVLEHHFAHLLDGHRAQQQWASSRFTVYDGLVPAAGVALDPTLPDGPVMSANGFQTIGKCPPRIFL